MTNQEAAEILFNHNIWRRGADVPQTDSRKLGEAIEVAVKALRESSWVSNE